MVGTIDIENGKLIFRLTGVDKVLALKIELKVPLTHVKSVSTDKADWNCFKMLKLAGARLPHVIASGTFVSKDGLLFYDMHDPDKCVTVELIEEKYKKIVFEVEDKEATANEIEQSLQELTNDQRN
jgi:hypothetical protein